MYACSIDLKQLPLTQRNKIVTSVQKIGSYYTLEDQVISMDLKTMKLVMEVL